MVRSDAEVLVQWIAHRDGAAYAELFSRHGAMLYSAARRLWRQEEDALAALEKAYAELPHWLSHRKGAVVVALHGALVEQAARRSVRQKKPRLTAQKNPAWEDIAPFIDEALSALPAKCIAPMILRYLESYPEAEVALRLGLDRITTGALLDKGLSILCRKLNRTGFSLSEAVLKDLLTEYLIEPAPTQVLHELQQLAESALESVERAGDAGLYEEFQQEQAPCPSPRKKIVAVLAAVLCCALLGAGLFALRPAPSRQDQQRATREAKKRLPTEMPAETAAPIPEAASPLVSELVENIQDSAPWTPPRFAPYTASDIAQDNGAHFFFLAAERMPQVKLDHFYGLWKQLLAGNLEHLDPFLALLERFEPALNAIRRGLEVGNCALPPLRGFGDTLPHGHRWVHLGRILGIEAQMLALDGDYPGALDAFATAFDFISESSRGGDTQEARRALVMADALLDSLRESLDRPEVLSEDLRLSVEQLQQWGSRRPTLWEAAQVETGNYRRWFESILSEEGDFSLLREVIKTPRKEAPAIPEMSPEEAQNVYAQAIEDYETLLQYLNWPYYETTTINLEAFIHESPVLQQLMPPLQQVYAYETRILAEIEGVRHVAAIEAFYRDQQRYPENLGELTPGYLRALPEDPFSGGAMRYEQRDGAYTLYCTGTDLIDNGMRRNAWDQPGGDMLIFRRAAEKAPPGPRQPPQ